MLIMFILNLILYVYLTCLFSGGGPSMSPFSGPGVKAKLLADPSTRAMMTDPSFLKVLNDLETNPETLKM